MSSETKSLSWSQRIFSVSGLTIFICVCGLIFSSVTMSQVKSASVFDENLYLDRLYRSTIQLLVISIIGILCGLLFLTGKFECRGIDDSNVLGRISPSIVLGLISLYVIAHTADMVNSFRKLSDDAAGGAIRGSVGFLLALGCIGIIVSAFFGYKSWSNDPLPEPPTNTKLDFHSNFINF